MKIQANNAKRHAGTPRGADRLVVAGAYVKLGSGLYEPTEAGRAAALCLRDELSRQCGVAGWVALHIERPALRYGPRQLRTFMVLQAQQAFDEVSAKFAIACLGAWLAANGVGNQRSERPGYTAVEPDQRMIERGSLRHSLAICERAEPGLWKLYVGVESVLIAITAVRGQSTIDFRAGA